MRNLNNSNDSNNLNRLDHPNSTNNRLSPVDFAGGNGSLCAPSVRVLDDMPVPVWRAAPDAKCDYFNPAWLDLTGRPLAGELGDGWTAGVHPEDLDRCVNSYLRAFRLRQSLEMEFRLLCREGSYRWLCCKGNPFSDDTGEFGGYIGICLDINEHKLMEIAARTGADQFRDILANIPGIVYRCANDQDWTMLFVSDAVEGVTGYPATDFIRNVRRSYSSIIHPADRERVAAGINAAVRRGQAFVLDYRIIRRDGAVRWVHESGCGHADGRDGIFVLDGVIFDVTEARRGADELRRNFDTQNVVNTLLHLSLRRLDMDKLLQEAFAAIVNIPWLPFDGRGAIFLTDEAVKLLRLAYNHGLPPEFPVSCSADEHLARGGHFSPADKSSPIGARYCAPLICAGRLVGLLVLCVRDDYQYDKNGDVMARYVRLAADVLAGVIARLD